MTSRRSDLFSWVFLALLVFAGGWMLVERLRISNRGNIKEPKPLSETVRPEIDSEPSALIAHSNGAREFPHSKHHDLLWRQVFGYIRDRNSSQFSGPPPEALEDLERSNPDLDLLHHDGIYISSKLRAGGISEGRDAKQHPRLQVCVLTTDAGVSLRVRARGPVLLLPCEKYVTEEEPHEHGILRQCYGFDFFVPGLYGIEVNVTYINGAGMCAGCKRSELFMVPGYDVADMSQFEDVPHKVVEPRTMDYEAEMSARKWSAMQWRGKSPIYSGNRVQGTPFLLFVPATLPSYERGQRLLHSNDMDALYQLAWNDSLAWVHTLSPVISAAFSVEDPTSKSTRLDCKDEATIGSCQEQMYELPFCTYDDVFYGYPLWTDDRLLESSNAILGTDGTAQTLSALSPKLDIDTHHGNFAILQSTISLGQRCKARQTATGEQDHKSVPDDADTWTDWRGHRRKRRHGQSFSATDDNSKQYCVRRRWTERQIVHRMQGEHVSFQGDSTMRCVFQQLVGYLDAQFHSRIGWMRHFDYGREAPTLVDQLRMYLQCANEPVQLGKRTQSSPYDLYDALWQRHRSAACLNLVPFIQTFRYELGKLNQTYHGRERTPATRTLWSSYLPARSVIQNKGRLAQVQREDVYICSRSLKPCKSNHLEWSLRSRLFEQYRQHHSEGTISVEDFCCFEFPLRNGMKYFSGISPQMNGTPWDPIRVMSTEEEMLGSLLSDFGFINTTGAQTALKDFAKSYYLLQVQLRASFSFASGVTFSNHYHLHENATRKVFTWGLGVVCGYSDVEVDALYDHFVDSVAETIEKSSPHLSRDKRYGHGAVLMNTPMRNRQKEFDRTGNSDASCSYYTNDRIARADAYMRKKYSELPPDVRVVEVDEMTDAFPEGIMDGSHMCGASSNPCEETVGSILDALFMP